MPLAVVSRRHTFGVASTRRFVFTYLSNIMLITPNVRRALKWTIFVLTGAFAIATISLWYADAFLPVPSASVHDPIIVVIGATGAGKSAFIKSLGGPDAHGRMPQMGHTLDPCVLPTHIAPLIHALC